MLYEIKELYKNAIYKSSYFTSCFFKFPRIIYRYIFMLYNVHKRRVLKEACYVWCFYIFL